MEKYLNKITQGNCLEILKELPSDSVDCVITSPPYNKGNKGEGNNWKNSGIHYGTFDDDLPESEYQEQQRLIIKELVRIIKPTGSIFYNHKPRQQNHKVVLPTEWMTDFDIRQVIIWDRNSTPDINPICFYKTTEWIVWITKGIPKFNSEYARFKEVWRFNPDMNNEHPAPFPEELPERCLLATTKENDVVLDCYMGSGTTGLVAERNKRRWIGIEMNPEYIVKAEHRINNRNLTLL